ncbi:Rne/Rng family ribonuclease [Roseivirga echinicomitans]|uniref:Ribonuclease G n=1 Tax=Roseivirga echinicomitans TaxID=296218 RepID=A0A150XYK5_9BACT|nr:Rne/Rng family ribonuclease [Roseivirga echinicomitans]KYG83685.1 ribonuclease G [Roseivirga echinicomitans]
MSNELVINSTQDGCRIALLKDKNLVEFHHDHDDNQFKVGDMYLGTVKKIVQGLNAAFIDIGYEKDAFLHYLDLGPQIKSLNKYTRMAQSANDVNGNLSKFKGEPDINKLGKMGQVLTRGQQILVQVVKEPISTKGPRLSCELSIAGRYMVLVPFSDSINISKKITDGDERKRLMRLISSIKPEKFGVIVRTVAKGKDVAELDKDLRNLEETWIEGIKKLHKAKPKDKVIGEMSRASSLLRDILNESFDSVSTDDKEIYNEIKSYIQKIAPDKEKIAKLYTGKAKIFEAFGIEKQFKSLFGKTVSLPKGGYLIIEHTEALHVIDVNSGNKSNAGEDQESTALAVNIEAAREVARQLRLRDMGGIIVIDFIDMRKAENKKQLYTVMRDIMEDDRAKNTVLPITKFGLMQITRQRVRPEMNITTRENCPTCGGTGKVAATILVSDTIEKNIDYILGTQNEKGITLLVHPFLHAYFTRGIFSKRWEWYKKYHTWVKIEKDSSLSLSTYTINNKLGEEIAITA